MAHYEIHVGSITNAMRGKQLLEQQGITAHLRRATAPGKGDGCGYSLLVAGDGQQAERLLRSRGVRVIRTNETL